MNVVKRVFTVSGELAALGEKIDGVLKELTAVGGTSACESYFQDANGDPRTDIGTTYAMLQNAASALTAAQTAINTHKTNLYSPKQ